MPVRVTASFQYALGTTVDDILRIYADWGKGEEEVLKSQNGMSFADHCANEWMGKITKRTLPASATA